MIPFRAVKQVTIFIPITTQKCYVTVGVSSSRVEWNKITFTDTTLHQCQSHQNLAPSYHHCLMLH